MTPPQTIAEAAAALRAGSVTAADLVEASLRAIDRHNPQTNAFIRVEAEAARAAAREVDAERGRGVDRGPLHGIPISLKDIIDVAGQPTTAAAHVLTDRIPDRDAPVVTRLRGAGAILIGKTNLHQFALGTTSEDSAFGPVRHPKDPTRSAGGSSGGSAAAVATGMGLASIGTDTGGSIRIPAAACGVVGLKPTRGEVPTSGVIPLSFTLDHVGPLARTVQDAAWLFAALTGTDALTLDPIDVSSLHICQLTNYFDELLADEVRAASGDALEELRQRGMRVSPRSLANTQTIVETYANLSLPEAAWWHEPYLDSRGSGYLPTIRARLEAGRTIPAVAYLRARQMRRAWRDAVDRALDEHDALVLPTLPIVAPTLGSNDVTLGNGTTIPVRGAMLRLTQLFNITGHPAITLPLRTSGLPVGLQLVGRRGETRRLLGVARACEAVVSPPISGGPW